MSYFLAGLGALVLILFLARTFVNADPKRLAVTARKLGGWGLIGIAGILALRGGLIAAVPLAMLGVALLGRNMPFGFPFPGGNTTKTAGQQSRVRTAYMEMFLDHDSGQMDGRVVHGRFAGRALSELDMQELIALWGECHSNDGQSAQLLEAYLDRRDPDWRASAGAAGHGAGQGPQGGGRRTASGPMTVEEAYEVLGLGPGAGDDDIRNAHRSLMKKLHPDQGGSTYLAAKLNEAKDTLLRQRG